MINGRSSELSNARFSNSTMPACPATPSGADAIVADLIRDRDVIGAEKPIREPFRPARKLGLLRWRKPTLLLCDIPRAKKALIYGANIKVRVNSVLRWSSPRVVSWGSDP